MKKQSNTEPEEERLTPSEPIEDTPEVSEDSQDVEEVAPPKRGRKPKAAPVEEKLVSATEQPAEVDEVKDDYLRQYQYRKQTVFGSVNSDPQPGSKAAIMKRNLLAQERVRVMIPRKQGEDKSIKYSVTLNGYRLDLPKQTYIYLPQQISDVIADSLGQTEAAIMRNQIDASNEKIAALG